ncbi:MAG: GHMP kinase [Acidobacteriota bacterium]|nr:GHMP kinase [Acidobacteriota bacterium]
MYRIVHNSTHQLSDVEAFVESLQVLDRHPVVEARTLFDTSQEIIVTRAPGRLDVMGGIADYSGSLVLQLSIREAALVALQRDTSPNGARMLRIVSIGAEGNNRAASFEMSLEAFERDGQLIDYASARAMFARDAARGWAAYVAGAFLVLMRERGARFPHGARMLIHSRVPEGKGVSSSAAIEVAVMQAVTIGFGVEVTPREVALLCQKVENRIVGAPCGVMDQMTAACGEEGELLALLCQPAELLGTVTLPREVAVWGIDSGVRHSVGGSDYTSVRVGAFMGYRMIAELAGLSVSEGTSPGHLHIADTNWRGYLANLSPSEFEQFYREHLPERMRGDEFLACYQGTTDAVTRVEPERVYAVRAPTAHPVYENFRVRAFAELLKADVSERQTELLGELMYQSHASYSACGIGSTATDAIVERVRAVGRAQGLYGAKITGGGSGGTVAVLGRRETGGAAVAGIAEEHARETGHPVTIFSGSSPGAAALGYVKLRP